MRIAYCIEGFYNHGGMERVVSVKANWLAGHGHDVSIIVARQGENRPAFRLDNVNLVDLGCSANDFKNSYRDSVCRILSQHNFDIVISTGGLELQFLYRINDGSSKIAEFHFTWIQHIIMGRIKGINTSFARAVLQTIKTTYFATKYDAIVCLTKQDATYYKTFTPKVYTIANPLTVKAENFKYNIQSKTIISIGRYSPQKGFDYLIRAWKDVSTKHPDWSLHIIGPHSNSKSIYPQCEKMVTEMKLSGSIKLLGYCEDMSDTYSSSSFIVVSSRYEGFSLALSEASSFGLPLISYDCRSGPRDIVINGENGILVRPVGDTHKLSEAICTLIENQDLRSKMSNNSLKSSARFAIGSIMHSWESLFSKLLYKHNQINSAQFNYE